MGSVEEGGLRLAGIIPKLAFIKQRQDSHNVLLHRHSHAFRLWSVSCSHYLCVQDHRLAGNAGEISLRAGDDFNNNPPLGKIQVHLPLFSESLNLCVLFSPPWQQNVWAA